MIKVYLHGALAQFGEVFELEVRDCAEAVTALASQIDGFADCIASGDWSVVIGDIKSGDSITDESLTIALKDGASIHIIPAIAGAGGIISAVVGITKIAWGASTGNCGPLSAACAPASTQLAAPTAHCNCKCNCAGAAHKSRWPTAKATGRLRC